MIRTAIMGLALAVLLAPAGGAAQQKSLRDQLIGTWRYDSITDTHADGTKVQTFGSKPSGVVIFQPNGIYAAVVSRPDLPKFAANSRTHGTAEENAAAESGSLGHWGTYTVNEADRTFTQHVLGSTYPNIIGLDRKFIIESLTEDSVVWIPLEATSGGRGRGVLTRVK